MRKPVRHGPNRRGFTLIELLVAVVIIAILAAISLKMVNVRDHAYEAQMVSDLRNLVSAQEAYFSYNYTYATNANKVDWAGTEGVIDVVVGKDAGGSVPKFV